MRKKDRMPLETPPVIKYLDPSSRAVDLANLCRRLNADWQYQDMREFGTYVEVQSDRSSANRVTCQLILKCLKKNGFEATPEMIPFLQDLPSTKYSVTLQPLQNRVTAKKFEAERPGCFKAEELLGIYWRLRLRFCGGRAVFVVARLVDEFRKQMYDGFLLPNGKVVPFDSMSLIYFWFVPKTLNVIDYQVPEVILGPLGKYERANPVIENLSIEFDREDGFLSNHLIIAFNLPESAAKDAFSLGNLMVLDPTCAQFGMRGRNGELLYWGSFAEYTKAFPAKKLIVKELKAVNVDSGPLDSNHFYTPRLMKAALDNLNSNFCGYCGEVNRKENPELQLWLCSKCKKVYYCDAMCQKLGWKGHKAECKL